MTGVTIVFEGVDGSGKSSLVSKLYNYLKSKGVKSKRSREPGGSEVAEEIRNILVNGSPEKLDSMTELLLMSASRRAHLRDTIIPAMNNSFVLILDRFSDSSASMQGHAGGLGISVAEGVTEMILEGFKPDLVFVVDGDPQVFIDRAKSRSDNFENRFEQKPISYHQKVREGFLIMAERNPDNHVIINGEQSEDDVFNQVLNAVNERFDF